MKRVFLTNISILRGEIKNVTHGSFLLNKKSVVLFTTFKNSQVFRLAKHRASGFFLFSKYLVGAKRLSTGRKPAGERREAPYGTQPRGVRRYVLVWLFKTVVFDHGAMSHCGERRVNVVLNS